MHRIKILITLLALAFSQCPLRAGASTDPFVQSINTSWEANDDAAVSKLIEASLKERPEDLVVLNAAYNYYMLIRPDLAKLTTVASQIKAVCDKSSNNHELQAYATRVQTRIAKLASEPLKPVDDQKRESIHKAFPKGFPGITVGISLQESAKRARAGS